MSTKRTLRREIRSSTRSSCRHSQGKVAHKTRDRKLARERLARSIILSSNSTTAPTSKGREDEPFEQYRSQKAKADLLRRFYCSSYLKPRSDDSQPRSVDSKPCSVD